MSQENFKKESIDYLIQALANMREILVGALKGIEREFNIPPTYHLNYLPTLIQLKSIFALSPIEQKILLLCVGCELDTDFNNLCAKLNNNPQLNYPTFNLALSIFDDFDLNLLGSQSSLQRNQIISIGKGSLISSTLKVNRRILNYLLAQPGIDLSLTSRIKKIDLNLTITNFSESHLQITKQIQTFSEQNNSTPSLHLSGTRKEILLNLAKIVAKRSGVELYLTKSYFLPTKILISPITPSFSL